MNNELFLKADALYEATYTELQSGKVYTLIGILTDPDDHHWALFNAKNMPSLIMLSCVSDIENYGFCKND